jgi:hypothetical protein
MGASLVAAAVINVCPSLGRNHASRVALLIMANTALDRDAEPWYGAGWKPIAAALGLGGSERTQRDRVTKVLGELEDLGVIRLAKASYPGTPAVYALQLHRLRLIHSVTEDPSEPVDNTHGITRAVRS